MSMKSLEEQRNTGIRFFKDDDGNVSYSFVKLNEIPKEMGLSVRELKLGADSGNSNDKAVKIAASRPVKVQPQAPSIVPVEPQP